MFRPHFKAGPLHTERIIAVSLNQAVEHFDVEAADPRMEKHIIPPVLVHIAEVPVALRIVLGSKREKVIIPLHIPVLA
ncbi:hypothetical protein D3C80_1394420 [compost metagenome]